MMDTMGYIAQLEKANRNAIINAKLLNNELMRQDTQIAKLETTNTELIRMLEQAIADIERTGYVSIPTVIKIEETIQKAKA